MSFMADEIEYMVMKFGVPDIADYALLFLFNFACYI